MHKTTITTTVSVTCKRKKCKERKKASTATWAAVTAHKWSNLYVLNIPINNNTPFYRCHFQMNNEFCYFFLSYAANSLSFLRTDFILFMHTHTFLALLPFDWLLGYFLIVHCLYNTQCVCVFSLLILANEIFTKIILSASTNWLLPNDLLPNIGHVSRRFCKVDIRVVQFLAYSLTLCCCLCLWLAIVYLCGSGFLSFTPSIIKTDNFWH